MARLQTLAGGVLLGLAGAVQAEVTFEGGITATYQQANDDRVEDEAFASADLVGVIPAGPGELTVYLEGNTTPETDGVSALLPEVNADAGSALDDDGDGRVQVSELHYTLPIGEARWLTVGLLDVTGFLDASDVANDETAQFLGGTFVNNPTIGFPDYTLGLVYGRAPSDTPGYVLTLTGSHGLADNPGAGYDELVELDRDEKGVFAAAELNWPLANGTVRAGIWANTAEHDRLDGTGTDANRGIYASIDGSLSRVNWNVRLGAADQEVAEAARFASLALEYPYGENAVGAAIGRIGASDELAGDRDDTTHAELYARFAVAGGFEVTPNVQWVENSGLDSSEAAVDASVTVVGMRFNYAF